MSENGKGKEELQSLLRQLPGMDRLLLLPATHDLTERYGRDLVVEALRAVLEAVRSAIIEEQRTPPMNATIVQEAREWLEALVAPTLRPVINATGVIIHTNLGRAPLSREALGALRDVAEGYSTLEYDLSAGRRGSRMSHAANLVTRLSGAEDALVVNNNAGAVLLMLSGLCQGREVIISRGQLVEIGGGFRVPDVMAQSGARLVEVGTTNRTHVRDYANAIGEDTAAILVAHHSNFKIVGFAGEPGLAELADVAHNNGLLLLYDQGSGALLDTTAYGLDPEPTVQDSLAQGVDVVAFSGDKLLGGPQAGILCGAQAHIDRLRSHPLTRALRPDKLCLSALSATLTHHLLGEAEKEIPIWRMIARSTEELEEQARAWAQRLVDEGVMTNVIDGFSTVGGGSLPGSTLPTKVLAIDHPHVEKLAAALREQRPPVIARLQEDQLLIDPRTVMPWQEEQLLEAVIKCAEVSEDS
ncbi:MAG: L-seryl-tRNA(Sec) selenium transferase [Chloroflexota bacterium]